MKRILLLAIFTLLTQYNTYAKLVGKVMGEDENRNPVPLKNARIMALPSKKGTLSDKNGNFELLPATNDTLLTISYVGYKSEDILISDISRQEPLTIQLVSNLVLEAVNVDGAKYASTLTFSDGVRTEGISSRGLAKCACCNLSESFAASPSVDVQFSDAITGAKRIELLGLQSTYSQILAENVPILRGLATTFGFALFPGQWLESISIAKGSSVAKNGFESISGLINLDYKKPQDENPTFLNLYINDMAHLELNADHTIKINDDISTMLFLHANDLFLEFDHNNDSFLDKPMGKQLNFMNRWFIKKDDFWNNVTAIHLLTDTKEGGQKGYFKENKRDLYGMNIKTNRYHIFTKNGFVLNDHGMSLGTILSFTHHKQEAFFGKRNYDGQQNSFYANFMFQTPLLFENSTLTTGASLQYDNYLESLDSLQMNAMENIPGLFAEYSFNKIENLSIIAGIRVDFPNNYKKFISPKLHAKYNFNDHIILSASIGKGYRIPHAIAENSGYLASSRNFIIEENILPEEAWNYGTNLILSFKIFDIPFDVNAEYFHTDFINQLVVDLDRNPQEIYFSNLTNTSYSNTYQVDITAELFKRFFITAAHRINDVKMTTNGILQSKALQSRSRSFVNFQYNTEMNEWAFDLTLNYNGKGRIPTTSTNPDEYKRNEEFDPYFLVNAQITKSFGDFEIYIGGENLTGFTQENPIIAADAPFSKYFDASLIWGPTSGAHYYLGLRYKFY
ncbi:MAG: TonB-dependent receptor [Ignavibacteria bacterium]|jgi:outer membrane receptor for ferrienterochelin and colicins|nr:TonB-dependent receptor [Ignavibacteria bacterium]